MAEALGEFGAKIVLTARKQNELDEAVAHLAGLGIEAVAIAADVGKPDEPARVIEEVKKAGGRIDILVNNAGTSWGSKTEEMPLDAWNKLLAVNLTGPFLLAQAVAREFMIPQGWGRIINIASVEGLLGHHPRMIGTIAYNASKGGLINFTRAVAAEWGGMGITVNAIAPGYFPSKLTGYVIDKHGEEMRNDTPRGQLGGGDDLKGATLLLASDASAHITGQTLVVDGGASII
jgi:gluconate 5-dehydrogenase